MAVTSSQTESCDVSICIPNCNDREVLGDLLESLQKVSDTSSIEVIVVDNGSADGSAEMVRQRFPWVKLIANDRNVGFAGANNQAARVALGRMLYFLNNDTVVPSGSTDTLVRFLDEHPEASAVGPQLMYPDGSIQPSCRNLLSLGALLHDQVRLLRWIGLFRSADRRHRKVKLKPGRTVEVEIMAGAALLVKREVYQTCGGWDEGFPFGYEDADLCIRLRARGALFYNGGAQVTHLRGVFSKANVPFVYSTYHFGCARYLRKHHPSRWAAPLYKLLATIDVPFIILDDAIVGIASALAGKRERASNKFRHLSAAVAFLRRDLWRFWMS